MSYLDKLRAQLAETETKIVAEVDARQAILDAVTAEERSALTPEEQTALDAHRSAAVALDAEAEELRQKIDAEVEAEAIRAKLPKALNVIVRPDAPSADARSVSQLSRTEVRDAAMRIVDAADSVVSLRSDQKDKLDRLMRKSTSDLDGRVIAERMILTENDTYRDAFAKVSLGMNAQLTADESRALAEFAQWEARAMSSTSSAGGYGVPVLIDPTMILTTQGHVPVVLQVCRHETITTDTWKGVNTAGVTWSYDTQGTEVSDDAPTQAQPSVGIHDAYGFVPFSNRIGMDYPGFAEEVSRLLMEGYLDQIASVTATGNGSTQPFGILTVCDANTNCEVTVTTDGGIFGQDLGKVWTSLGERYRDNATWIMSADTGEEVAAFGNGNNLSYVSGDLRMAQTDRIRNRPVLYSDYFPSFTASTGAANLLVVGDFRNYVWAERAGMSVEYVPHLFGTSNPGRPTNQRGLWAWARHGGNSINDLAFRILQNT